MDRRERSGSPATALLAALDGWQAQVWTALTAVVTAFNPAERTVTAQPVIQVRAQNPDGTFEWVTMPLLLDCPVVFPGGGGVTLTFPIKPGDEVLIVIASRCIDAWWQQGGHKSGDPTPTPQVQMEFRMHSLSDGFCVPGLNSKPLVIPGISVTTAQLRSDTGLTFVEVDPADGFVNVVTSGDIGATAGGSINADAGADITAHAAGDVTSSSDGSTTINASGGCTINAETTINGNTVINGTLRVSGGVKAPSYAGLTAGSGTMTVHSAVIDTARINGITVDAHTHMDPQGGNTGPMQ